jgi:glutamate-5-semialdehyde dehydrogenase
MLHWMATILPSYYTMPAPEHFGTEFLSLKMAVKTVATFKEALDHIAQYSSKHSEAIVSENAKISKPF